MISTPLLNYLETQIRASCAESREYTKTEISRIEKKLDIQSRILGAILVTSFIPTLQSMGIHTANWLPDAVKLALGFVHI